MQAVQPSDSVFLMGESRRNPTHVLGLQLFRPPIDASDDWLRAFYGRLQEHTTVKEVFRRRPHRSIYTAGQWFWEHDDDIDLQVHVQRAALPAPGRTRELLAYVSDLHGTLLDQSRPLWEMRVVEGLADGRFAVCTKLHHSLFDGITMTRHLLGGLSNDPEARACLPPWAPAAEGARDGHDAPGYIDQIVGMARSVGRAGADAPALLGAALSPLLDELHTAPFAAPRTMFNVPISGSRRFAGDVWSLDRVDAVGKTFGGTLNDVALTMCGGALRRYLLDRGALPEAPLVAMVPVSLRGTDTGAAGSEGNAFGMVLCDLGTDLDDAAARFDRVRESMQRGKNAISGLHPWSVLLLSGVAAGGAVLDAIPGVPRPPRPAFNLIVSNVPIARERKYWDGAELTDVYPISMILDGQALNITLTSYVDRLAFGLTGCRRAVPHLQRMLAHLESELGELEAARP